MKLVVVRHLPTPWNLEGRLQGQRDIAIVPLTDETRAALANVRTEIAAHAPFDRVYCSTLGRTRQTAEALGFNEAAATPLLDELNFGEYEGQLRHVLLDAHGDAWYETPHELAFGEKVTDLELRVRRFLEETAKTGTVLAFGHGGWMRALRSLRETGSIAAMNKSEIGNAGVLVFEL